MAKTNTGLVTFAKRALTGKFGYVWGTFGQTLTENLFNAKVKQYPGEVGKYADFIRRNYIGRRTVDCVGLVKAYLWWNDSKDTPEYDPATDVNTNMMYDRAAEKGPIGTIDKTLPGIVVYKSRHVGVSCGDGYVIEAAGTTSGVIKTPLTGSGATKWTHWLKPAGITYESPKPTPSPAQPPKKSNAEIAEEVIAGKWDNGDKRKQKLTAAGYDYAAIQAIVNQKFPAKPAKPANPHKEPTTNLKKGSKGDGVKWIQWALKQRGYDLGKAGIDGDFGTMTDKAVRAFQKAQKIAVDGIVGPVTRGKLK